MFLVLVVLVTLPRYYVCKPVVRDRNVLDRYTLMSKWDANSGGYIRSVHREHLSPLYDLESFERPSKTTLDTRQEVDICSLPEYIREDTSKDNTNVTWVHTLCPPIDFSSEVSYCDEQQVSESVREELNTYSSIIEWNCSDTLENTIDVYLKPESGLDYIEIYDVIDGPFTTGGTIFKNDGFIILWLPEVEHEMGCGKRNIYAPIWCSSPDSMRLLSTTHTLSFEKSFTAPLINKKVLYRSQENIVFGIQGLITISDIIPDVRYSSSRPECGKINALVVMDKVEDMTIKVNYTDVSIEYEWFPDYYCCTAGEDDPYDWESSTGSLCCAGQTAFEDLTDYNCEPTFEYSESSLSIEDSDPSMEDSVHSTEDIDDRIEGSRASILIPMWDL